MKSSTGTNNNLHEMLLEEFNEIDGEFRVAVERLEAEAEEQILELLERYAEIVPAGREYFTGRYAHKRAYKIFQEQFDEFGTLLEDPSALAALVNDSSAE
jgi:hypothetical protein